MATLQGLTMDSRGSNMLFQVAGQKYSPLSQYDKVTEHSISHKYLLR